MYRWGCIIGHFTVHVMVGCTFSGSSLGSCPVAIGLSCELEILRYERERPWSMVWHDNEQTIALWTSVLRAYEGTSSELIPPGPRSRASVQLN